MGDTQWKDAVDNRLQLQTQQINALAGLVQADEAYKELSDRFDVLQGGMMPKLQRVMVEDIHTGYYFDCPGCESGHFVTVRPHKAENGASWEYNGNIDAPSFSPSILSRWQFTQESGKQDKVCPQLRHRWTHPVLRRLHSCASRANRRNG